MGKEENRKSSQTPPVRLGRVAAGLLTVLALHAGPARAAPGKVEGAVVSNVTLSEERSRVVVHYDLEAPAPVPVRLVGSRDGGRTFGLSIRSVRGDVGARVAPGSGKSIEWSYRADYPDGLDRFDVTLEVAVVGQKYFVVPLRGRFGVELDEDYLQESLRLAAAADPRFLVLEVESPGGSALEMEDMLDMLLTWREEHPSIRVVALVRGEAAHAASLFALAADAVFLEPGACVGADESNRPGGREVAARDHEVPQDLLEKAKALARARGIPPALVDAMVRPLRVALVLLPGEKREVAVLRPGPVPARHLPLSDGSRPLRLRAADAVLVGFARGIVKDLGELGDAVGQPGWVSGGDGSRELAAAFARQVSGALSAYDDLAAMIREGLARAEDPGASGPLDARDAGEFLEFVDDLQWLSRAMPFVEARVDEDFPGGVRLLHSRFEALVPRTAYGAPPAVAKASARARSRRGATRQGFEFTQTPMRG